MRTRSGRLDCAPSHGTTFTARAAILAKGDMMAAVIPSWSLKGTVLVACNCDYGCPCNFNALPTTGDCEGAWTWHIAEGRYGDTRLHGLHISMAADWPKAIHEGNGEAIVLIDELADEAQRQALVTLATGKVGGPWAIIGATLTKIHDPEFVHYALTLSGHRTTLRAGAAMEMEFEPIRNPVSGAEVHPGAVLPEGFIFKEGSFASSKTFSVRGGVNYEHPGKYAAFGPFEYQGP